MKSIEMQGVVENIRKTVASHRLCPGGYARWLWQDGSGKRELDVNPYGCADAANILYTIGALPRELDERAASVEIMQRMQNPETGLFRERTHGEGHTTAHVMAALELFDAAPLHRAYALEQYLDPAKMDEFLNAIDWKNGPWIGSHRGAGLYVSLNLGGSDTHEFNRNYFEWLWEHADPETGFWRVSDECRRPLFDYMAASFHYLFNHEAAHMPLRYPERMIDSCIDNYRQWRIDYPDMATTATFKDIDWVFCLTRASRQSAHRFDESRELLSEYATGLADYWLNADWEHDETINDLYCLFGGVCALAEIQQTIRGLYLTDKPLRLVLDRRPFI